MNRSEHLATEIERCRKRGAPSASAANEAALRRSFTASLPAGVGAELAADLFDYYVSLAVGPEAEGALSDDADADPIFSASDRLVALSALFNGELDDDAEPFTVDELSSIGDIIADYAEKMDMGVLTSVMSLLLARGALDGKSANDEEGEEE